MAVSGQIEFLKGFHKKCYAVFRSTYGEVLLLDEDCEDGVYGVGEVLLLLLAGRNLPFLHANHYKKQFFTLNAVHSNNIIFKVCNMSCLFYEMIIIIGIL